MAAMRASRFIFQRSWSLLSNYTKNNTIKANNIHRSLSSTVEQKTLDNRDEGLQAADVVPETRKEFRKFRSRIYKQNRMDPEMERQARKGELKIDLTEVNKVWMAREGFKHIHKMTRHYQIFSHVFDGMEFTPTRLLDISYGEDSCRVNWGNFITPSQAISSPNVNFEGESNLWSLILINPDGNVWHDDAELLHWFIANIPGNDVQQGTEVATYLPPIPQKGTGYHRYVFCLLHQKGHLNTDQITSHNTSFSSQRSFKMAELLASQKDFFTPAGLSFFQASWDETVTETYRDTLGIQEPSYVAKPFVTPTNQRKQNTQDAFNHKYRNM